MKLEGREGGEPRGGGRENGAVLRRGAGRGGQGWRGTAKRRGLANWQNHQNRNGDEGVRRVGPGRAQRRGSGGAPLDPPYPDWMPAGLNHRRIY